MLTVKIMSLEGGEEIHCGASVGYNPKEKSISVSGMDGSIFLAIGEVAYVMNEQGKTISWYPHNKTLQTTNPCT